MGRIVICRYCGAEIVFIKPAGREKALPCEPALVPYKLGGYERLLADNGEMVSGYLHYPADEEPDGMAHRLHFATCPAAQKKDARQ